MSEHFPSLQQQIEFAYASAFWLAIGSLTLTFFGCAFAVVSWIRVAISEKPPQ